MGWFWRKTNKTCPKCGGTVKELCFKPKNKSPHVEIERCENMNCLWYNKVMKSVINWKNITIEKGVRDA